MSLENLKQQVIDISSKYPNREQRARRLFIEEKAASLHAEREREFSIKTDISAFMEIPYTSISFCGSAQLGFSIHKDRLFQPTISDLDVACVNVDLFQRAWQDIIETTRAFSDLSAFGTRSVENIGIFKEQILRRGMININSMPYSNLNRRWLSFQNDLSRKHNRLFRKITIAVYMNEYAFCWKQDSSLAQLVG